MILRAAAFAQVTAKEVRQRGLSSVRMCIPTGVVLRGTVRSGIALNRPLDLIKIIWHRHLTQAR